MVFQTFPSAYLALLLGVFVLALIVGAVANKTNFCTMGAVSDVVNMQDWNRMRAWLLAIAVAMLGVALFEMGGLVNADQSSPPFRSGNFQWPAYLLGGFLFGIGMTLASGCGNKTLVRVGAGNAKSVVVMLIMGTVAYFMIYPVPGLGSNLREFLFLSWMAPANIQLSHGQDIGSILSGGKAGAQVRLLAALLIGGGLLYFIFRNAQFRADKEHMFGGTVIGLCVLGVWLVTSNVSVQDQFGGSDNYSLSAFVGQEWDFQMEPEDLRPAEAGLLRPQGLNFMGPTARTVGWGAQGFNPTLLNVGVMMVLGVIAGSLLWALLSRTFRFEWFASARDVGNHVFGAVLMGLGGVLAMGCTFGQAISGMSTLALGSALTFAAIVFGSALTMKIQLYLMVYEDEATFADSLITALVDLRLLPAGLRKFDAI